MIFVVEKKKLVRVSVASVLIIFFVSVKSFSQPFERLYLSNMKDNVTISGMAISSAYELKDNIYWVTEKDPKSSGGIYNLSKGIFLGKDTLSEGFLIKNVFFKLKQTWIIISEYGEEDGFWSMRIYSYSNGKYNFEGDLNIAKLQKDPALGDVFVFPIENMHIRKVDKKTFIELKEDNYVFDPKGKDQKYFTGKVEFEILK